MRIYSIAIPAYLSSTILFATALPTPFPTSRGLSPCIAVGTDSIHDLTLNNVCNEADKVTGPPPTTFGDEHDLQPRGTPRKLYSSVTIPYGFREHVSDIPFTISKPHDRSKITPEEQSRVDEIMQKLEACLARLDPADKLHRHFTNFKSRVRVDLGYIVKKEAEKPRPIKIPSALRDNQPGLPEKINPPADPSKSTPEEQQHVSAILQKLYTSIADLGPKDDLRRQFANFKSNVKLELGYDVNYETEKKPRYLNIPSPLRDKLPADLPERIFAPHDPLNITPEEQQHVFTILRQLKASIADVRNKSSDKRCQQFYQLKSNLHRNLGYEVNENSAPKVASESLSTESVGETSGTSYKPVAQAGPSGGDTSTG